MKSKLIIWPILLMLAFTACRKEQWNDCFTGAGEVRTIERIIDDFHTLDISDAFDIILIQDSSRPPFIQIEGPKNLLEGVVTETQNGILSIQNSNICNFVRSFDVHIKLTINIHSLDAIYAIGNSTIQSTDTLQLDKLLLSQSATNEFYLNVHANEITVQSIDAGEFLLEGKSKSLKGSLERVSELDARNLVCEDVLIDSHTPLDLFVHGTRVVFVKIFNRGNIYYQGTPSEKLELNEKTGSGQLLPLP